MMDSIFPAFWRRVILSLVIFSVFANLLGQSEKHCTTYSFNEAIAATYPQKASQAEFEAWMSRKMGELKANTQVRDEVYTLPVVVHIIHEAGEAVGVGHNLSQTQIASQIQVMNEDFRRMVGTNGDNSHPDGADIEIEFCLTPVDEAGNPMAEPGINRLSRADFPTWPDFPWTTSIVSNFVQALTIWDPEEFINIWVVDLEVDPSEPVLGFSSFPDTDSIPGLPGSGIANRDGVVINYTNFGNTGNVSAPYDLGRTATHEMGHFFGLLHLWGNIEMDCDEGDYCDDTPWSEDPNYGCPVNANSCGSADMVENYMNYTDDLCMNVFTMDQKWRMRTVLTYAPRRANLINSDKCSGGFPPAPGFSANFTTVCEESYVTFTDTTPNATSRLWTFSGGIPATSTDAKVSVKYNNPGTYSVTLESTNAAGSNSLTKTDFIQVVNAGLAAFFEEDFESGLGNWTVENPDNNITWTTKTVGGTSSGSKAAWMDLYFYVNQRERDELISPIIDLTGQTQVELRFDHAYRQFESNNRDSLLVFVSVDGGQTWPHLLLAASEAEAKSFATNGETLTSFVPNDPEDWCFAGSDWADCISLDLSDFDSESQFRFKFVSVNDYGNNIYIDNVQLWGACTAIASVDELYDIWDIQLFPNPSSGSVNLGFYAQSPGVASLNILNVLGQEVYTKMIQHQAGEQEFRLDLNALPAGTYWLRLRKDQQSYSLPLWLE